MLSLVNQPVFTYLGALLHISRFSEIITHIPGGDGRCKAIHVIKVLGAMWGCGSPFKVLRDGRWRAIFSKELIGAGP